MTSQLRKRVEDLEEHSSDYSANHKQHTDGADLVVRRLIASVIRASAKSREHICEEMSVRLGRTVTRFMLDDFTAESKGDAATKSPARFPAAWIDAFCEATEDNTLRMHVMGARCRKLVEFAERELSALRDEQERRRLRSELAGGDE